MIDDNGKFNEVWLHQQSTDRLRYEARCERLAGWQTMTRHKLTLALGQLQIIPAAEKQRA